MLGERSVIAVIGAGAVGAYYGGRLLQHGRDVHFLLRSDYRAVRANGWSVRSCDGDFTIPPDALRIHDDAHNMPAADLVMVTMKTTSNDQYRPLIAPILKPDTAILTLQNGLGNEERLAELFGADRVFGALCFVCINRIAPGVIHHTDYGLVRLGSHLPSRTGEARRIVEVFSACGIECQLVQDLRFGRWEKLMWNVPFNGLGGILDLSTDRLMACPAGIDLLRSIMQEVLAAARANGANLPDEIIGQMIDRTQTMGAYKSSMQLDRELGREMEIEAILGEPVRAARRAGVAVPLMTMFYQLAQVIQPRPPKPA